ncbi:hypothetical protein [Paenibacillus sp. GCM10027626]|uniref:hypothetical protein n=1 Tax=Paenibacillus sp. GCM10027626 TaxID=3273411 RepID=UPI003632D6FC
MSVNEIWKNGQVVKVTEQDPLPVMIVGGGGGDVPDGSINTAKLADGAVTEEKLAADAVAWSRVTGKPNTFPPESHTHTAAQISDASAVGRSVLTAADQAVARTAIGAGTSSQNLTAITAAEATAGTAATARAITAAVLAGAINERTKNKPEVAALTPIADPATATMEEVATTLNALISALKS